MAALEGILAHLRKRWFLLGVVAVIILAKMHPFVGAKGGEDMRGEGVGPLVHFRKLSMISFTCNSTNVFTPIPIKLVLLATSCCQHHGV